MSAYSPERGDIVWLALFMPIASQEKNPFEILLDLPKIKGVILADQIKAWIGRSGKRSILESAPLEIF